MLSMGIPGVPSTLPLLFLLDAPAGCYIPLQSDLASRGHGRQWAATGGTQLVYALFSGFLCLGFSWIIL